MCEKENRFIEKGIARSYTNDAHLIVPVYNRIQDKKIEIASNILEEPNIMMDLGSGGGGFIKKFLIKYPHCKAVAVDSSTSMLEVAKERLKDFKDRITYLERDISSCEWTKVLEVGFEFITSDHTIHHLRHNEKKQLYSQVYNLLNNGGLFIHADEIMASSHRLQKYYLEMWDKHVRKYWNDLSYDSRKIWEKWYQRNIKDYGGAEQREKDIWASLDFHVESLRHVGFKDVECYFKDNIWAVFGGIKEI